MTSEKRYYTEELRLTGLKTTTTLHRIAEAEIGMGYYSNVRPCH
jgi:hypothetical protein